MNIKFISIFFLLMLNMCFFIIDSHKMPQIDENILDPTLLRPYMFTQQISGKFNIMVPTSTKIDLKGKLSNQNYIIEMKKIKQQILPKSLFNETTIYAYGGQTQNGYIASFPGPAIMAKIHVPIRITWRNSIQGKHILPMDFNYPFMQTNAFRNEVPTVPHAHGISTSTNSDGQPQSYWTKSGAKAVNYNTLQVCETNEAVFEYPNQQEASNNWYHDHTMGITRLNVYAGLVGFYKIIDQNSANEKRIINLYGQSVSQNLTKYLIITDKSFTKNGELYYSNKSDNPNYSSWVPQFFGNTILVNGVLWPKITVLKGKYRFVILNACQDRYLNIHFENLNKKIPIQLLRIDGDYFQQQIIVQQITATIASRIEFILDLTSVKGQVIMKNTAAAPYPQGDPINLNPQFTGQILKIVIKSPNLISMNQLTVKNSKNKQDQNRKKNLNIQDINQYQEQQNTISPYPAFPEGQKVFSTIFQVLSQDDQVQAMFIDGVSMNLGKSCVNSTYKIGQVYDFHIINLSPDAHPIHFHLINLQKVKQFPFNVQAYSQKYFTINGGVPSRHGFSKPPIPLDPQEFRTGKDQLPQSYQKVFRDTVDCMPNYVTVLRIKFAKNDGSNFNSFDLKGQRFVWHCHMLQHEDNQLMKYFCLQ